MPEFGSPEEDEHTGLKVLVCAVLLAVAVGLVTVGLSIQRHDCAEKGGTITGHNLCVAPDGRILP